MTTATPGVMVNVSLQGLRCALTHGPSGTEWATVPPKDNGGDGSSFSPTDMVAAALGACALTTLALVAGREGLAFGPATATVEKRMTPPPRRIGELVVVINMPKETRADQRARLEEIATTCPVARSLHPDVKVPMAFRYP